MDLRVQQDQRGPAILVHQHFQGYQQDQSDQFLLLVLILHLAQAAHDLQLVQSDLLVQEVQSHQQVHSSHQGRENLDINIELSV